MPSAKWRPFILGLNVLKLIWCDIGYWRRKMITSNIIEITFQIVSKLSLSQNYNNYSSIKFSHDFYTDGKPYRAIWAMVVGIDRPSLAARLTTRTYLKRLVRPPVKITAVQSARIQQYAPLRQTGPELFLITYKRITSDHLQTEIGTKCPLLYRRHTKMYFSRKRSVICTNFTSFRFHGFHWQ